MQGRGRNRVELSRGKKEEGQGHRGEAVGVVGEERGGWGKMVSAFQAFSSLLLSSHAHSSSILLNRTAINKRSLLQSRSARYDLQKSTNSELLVKMGKKKKKKKKKEKIK